MSSLLSAELAATCSALGYFDQGSNKYFADSNTLETVKDLIRYLRRDDDNHDIRRQLGQSKVLQTDLLPLLKSYWEETDLFDVLLRLMVNLTTPALVLWHEEIPTDKNVRNHYLQIEDHLQCYKQAFADEAFWAVLSTRLSKIIEIDYNERGEENGLIIERILILIRNILKIAADPYTEKRTDNDASVHDQVLWALYESGMLDIILYMSGSSNEQAYYMHILEILSSLLREQNASELAEAALQRSESQKTKDQKELSDVRQRETIEKQKKTKHFYGSRHSRFCGTYVVTSMKAISDENSLIYHKPLNTLDSLNFDADKTKPKTHKNRLPLKDFTYERQSALSVKLFLKQFCLEFLNGAYNNIMYYVKDNLSRSKAQAHDESYYLWCLRFFMEFNRHYKFEVKLVSETMSVQTFHYVQQQMEAYFDTMQTDKKKVVAWSRRLHLALLAYRELLLTLSIMDRSADGSVRDSSKVIKNNIFYVLEYRELILSLLVTYDEIKMSNLYLKDLLETQHIFLKIFEKFCQGTVMVQQKSKGKKPKKNPTKPVVAELDLERDFDEISPQLASVLDSGNTFETDIIPFDAASDVPIDDQKSDAMKMIQRILRSKEFEKAVALLRACRPIWPENDCFGSVDMPPEEEFLALRDIFFADLGQNKIVQPAPVYNSHFEEEEVDEEDEGSFNFNEGEFKFEDFLKRFAHPKIVRACGLALKDFETNSDLTNHCIVKLLHRIAFDCKMYVMVFQVSTFMTFQKIFPLKQMTRYKELIKFATYIIRQFLRVADINKKVYLEALFWKNSKDAFDIEEGYGTYQEKHQAATKVWAEEEEDELRRLFMEHATSNREDNVVDFVCENLIDQERRSRRGVMKKLKEMHLLRDEKAPREWGEDEEEQLREMYEQFKNAIDPLDCIIERLNVKRPKTRIIDKLLVLGLIQDRKDVRKKWSSQKKRADSEGSNSDSDNDVRSSNAGRHNSNPGTSRGGNKKSKSKKRTSKSKLSQNEVSKAILSIKEKDMIDALEWIKDSLNDALEDLDDEDESIALVPILECSINAMEDPEFKNMLKAFGLVEPFDEQESYWRIPSDIDRENVKSIVELLGRGIGGTLEVVDDPPEILEEPSQTLRREESDGSSDEDALDKLREIRNRKKELEESEAGSSGSYVNGDVETPLVNSQDVDDTVALGDSNHSVGFVDQENRRKLIDTDIQSSDSDDNVERQSSASYVNGDDNVERQSNSHDSSDNSDVDDSTKNASTNSQSRRTRVRKQIEDSSDSDEKSSNSKNVSEPNSPNVDDSSMLTVDDPTKNVSTSTQKRRPRMRKPIEDSSDPDEESSNYKNVNEPNSQNIDDSSMVTNGRIIDSDEDDSVSRNKGKSLVSRSFLESDSEEEVNTLQEGSLLDGDKENYYSVDINTSGDKEVNKRGNSDSESEKPRRKRLKVIIDSDDESS